MHLFKNLHVKFTVFDLKLVSLKINIRLIIVKFKIMSCSGVSSYLLLQLMRCKVKIIYFVTYLLRVTKLSVCYDVRYVSHDYFSYFSLMASYYRGKRTSFYGAFWVPYHEIRFIAKLAKFIPYNIATFIWFAEIFLSSSQTGTYAFPSD
jgi:hypothetical protein